MSSFMAQARARALRPGFVRPRLTIVPKVAARAPRIPFVLLVVTVLAAGLVGLLVLNTSLQRGAYHVTELRSQAAALEIRQQTLEIQVAALQEPQRVAEEAVRLGMVQNDSPVFLSLATGRLIGKPVAGVAGNSLDLGHLSGLDPRRTNKVNAVAGGQFSSASTGLTTVKKDRTTPADKNRRDTRDGSQGRDGSDATNNNSITN